MIIKKRALGRTPTKCIYLLQDDGRWLAYAGKDGGKIIYEDENHPAKRYKEGVAHRIAGDILKKYGIRFELRSY